MTEFVTAPDGVRIAFEIVGQGAPILLIHGFGSDRTQNWRAPGWYQTLTGANYSVIALDCRGHGESDKPRQAEDYAETRMAEDALLVMNAAGAAQAFVMGYSMGGAIAVRLAFQHPLSVRALVTGGVGETYFSRTDAWRAGIAEALLAQDDAGLSPVQRMFRDFVSQPGKNAQALAACMRASRGNLSPEQLTTISPPALVVCGEIDDVSGPPAPLAKCLADADAVVIPRRDHMLTVGDKLYKQAALRFLGRYSHPGFPVIKI
jgi:pimeloyl-ACP methyl ester carboxylesterase